MVRKLRSESETPKSIQPIAALQSQFDALALQVRAWAGKRSNVLTLGVLGTAPGVGASTVACNLANSLAESSFTGQVLLVESEPAFSREQLKATGLVDILAREAALSDSLESSYRENLKVLPFGRVTQVAEREKHLAKVIDFVQRELLEFDFVIFDLLPLSQSKASGAIGCQLDGLLLVCGPERARTGEVEQLETFLRNFSGQVLGKVINRTNGTGRAR